MTTVLATLKSDKHVVRVIRRVVCNCDDYTITDATNFPFEVQVLSCGTRGRYSYINAFDELAHAIRCASDKFTSLHTH